MDTQARIHTEALHSVLQDGCGIIRQRSVVVLSRNGHTGGIHQSGGACSPLIHLVHTHTLTNTKREGGTLESWEVQTHTQIKGLVMYLALSLYPTYTQVRTHTISFV